MRIDGLEGEAVGQSRLSRVLLLVANMPALIPIASMRDIIFAAAWGSGMKLRGNRAEFNNGNLERITW